MTNKILLAAIALGVWANAAVSCVRPAQAQDGAANLTSTVGDISHRLDNVTTQMEDIQTNVVRLLVGSLNRTKRGAN